MSVEVGPVYWDVNLVRTIADGTGDLEGWYPWDVTHNPVSGHILVTDCGGNCIRLLSDNLPYTYITKYGRRGEGEGEYMGPHGITCDSEGRVIVVDEGNERLQVLSPTGQYRFPVTGGIISPDWVCLDGEDNMYVASDDYDDGDYIRVYNRQSEPLPIIMRRGHGEFTNSGEHLYEVEGIDHIHIHIHSLTDWSDVKSVLLPQQIPNDIYSSCIHMTVCRDGRLLITARGWRANIGNDNIDEDHSYIYVLDGAGRNLTPRPYRYDGRVRATILLYDNTLVVVDIEDRLVLVTLPGLDPPLQPTHPVRVTSIKHLCLYKIRSIIRHPHDVHKLPEWVAPGLISNLLQLYS